MNTLASARRARGSSSGASGRLNAFGQPFQGRKIHGVGAVERARGKAFSSLTGSQRESYGNQKAFGAELEAQAMSQEVAAAAARGQARAQQSMAPAISAPAPEQETSGGSGGWFQNLATTGKKAMLAAARRERGKQGVADRARARARYEQEQRGSRPESYAPFQFAA